MMTLPGDVKTFLSSLAWGRGRYDNEKEEEKISFKTSVTEPRIVSKMC
jgi:hypothetical protein